MLEMLAVVVIIGVLAAIAIPAFIGSRASAEKSACDSNRKAILTAISNFQSREGKLVAASTAALTASSSLGSQLLAGGYLSVVPPEPANTASLYNVTVDTINSASGTAAVAGFKVTVVCTNAISHGTDIASM